MKRIIDKLKIHNRIRVGYGTAFFLLLISYLITLYSNKKLSEQSGWVDHTNNTIIHLEKIMSDIKDGETGARGYALTKDAHFLDPYYTSRARVDTSYNLLKQKLLKARCNSKDSTLYTTWSIASFKLLKKASGFCAIIVSTQPILFWLLLIKEKR